MPILIRSANPLNKKVFPDDSRQLNHLNQALQLVGNSEEHYRRTQNLVEGKQMQDFSMSKTCAVEKCVSSLSVEANVTHIRLLRHRINMPHILLNRQCQPSE
jgi:ABC-type oligopeptide transport system ATPase subunit